MFQEIYLHLLTVQTIVLIIVKQVRITYVYQFVLDLVELANRGAALLYRLLIVSSLSFNLTR